MSDNQSIHLVDSSIYIFRAWFSMPDSLTGADGQLVNAVYGFSHFVMQLLQEREVERIVFAFDANLTESFRNEIYPPYKANRELTPPELKDQFQYCRDLIDALGFTQLASNIYEADDLIGSLALQEKKKGNQVIVVSGDKDLVQVIKEDDYWWDYAKRVKLNKEGVYKKFGVYPEQMSDMLAIAGDAVDNIPGIQGIGPVTAKQLLNRFGSLEGIFNHLSEIGELKMRGAQRIERLLREYYETAKIYHRLTKIYCQAPLPDDVEAKQPDIKRLENLLRHIGFSDFRIKNWIEFMQMR